MGKRSPFHKLPLEKRLGDAPVEAQYAAQMQAMMEALDEFLNGKERPRKTGLVIMMFPYDDHSGRCNFMSNGADRRDVVTLMREMIARFEGQPEIKGRA